MWKGVRVQCRLLRTLGFVVFTTKIFLHLFRKIHFSSNNLTSRGIRQIGTPGTITQVLSWTPSRNSDNSKRLVIPVTKDAPPYGKSVKLHFVCPNIKSPHLKMLKNLLAKRINRRIQHSSNRNFQAFENRLFHISQL